MYSVASACYLLNWRISLSFSMEFSKQKVLVEAFGSREGKSVFNCCRNEEVVVHVCSSSTVLSRFEWIHCTIQNQKFFLLIGCKKESHLQTENVSFLWEITTNNSPTACRLSIHKIRFRGLRPLIRELGIHRSQLCSHHSHSISREHQVHFAFSSLHLLKKI
jgi:hypothetical protein